MSQVNWLTESIEDFGGAQLFQDPTDVPKGGALLARNCEFIGTDRGSVQTRRGFLQAFNANEAVTSLFNWLSSLGNYLVWFRSSDRTIRYIDVSANPPVAASLVGTDLVGHGAIFANLGSRLAVAPFSTAGRGVAQGRIVSKQSGAFVNDSLFPGPISFVPGAPAETIVGNVTAGTHRLGYQIEFRGGFTGRPSPDTSGTATPSPSTFAPLSAIASGGKQWSWAVGPVTWPTGAINVYPVMTTAANLNKFIRVPGQVVQVTGGLSSTPVFTINISDEDLLASVFETPASEVTASLSFWTQNTSGLGPFNPYYVLTHGERTVYLTTIDDRVGNSVTCAAISNKGSSQELSIDQHLIFLPGKKDITTALSLGGVLYLIGPSWTYAVSDNGDVPVTWPTPHKIDHWRGTLAIRGAVLGGRKDDDESSTGDHAWVADRDGLFLFNGAYASLPISYTQSNSNDPNIPDWDRINWNYAYLVQVTEDPDNKLVMVLIPWNTATTPSHLLVWDYTNGMDFESARHSYWNLSGYSIGAIAMVQNTLTGGGAGVFKKLEAWLGPSNAAPILRRASTVDTNPYRDNGAAINFQYETALLPSRRPRGKVLQHYGEFVRPRGAGSLAMTVYSIDRTRSIPLNPIQLEANPGKEILRKYAISSEAVSVRYQTNAADAHVQIAGQRHLYRPWVETR